MPVDLDFRNKDKYHDRDKRPDTDNPNAQFWWYRGHDLNEDTVRYAIENSNSNCGAARLLGISYKAWKKYSSKYRDLESGVTLFELQKQKSGAAYYSNKGAPKIKRKDRRNWDKLLREGQKPTKERIQRLKDVLISSGKLKHKCNKCGYDNHRVEDNKKPIILFFRNGKKSDWRFDNLELVCYNCAFVCSLDFFRETMIQRIESTEFHEQGYAHEIKAFNQIDDFYLEHMRNLGIDENEIDPQSLIPKTKSDEDGSEFIDRF